MDKELYEQAWQLVEAINVSVDPSRRKRVIAIPDTNKLIAAYDRLMAILAQEAVYKDIRRVSAENNA